MAIYEIKKHPAVLVPVEGGKKPITDTRSLRRIVDAAIVAGEAELIAPGDYDYAAGRRLHVDSNGTGIFVEEISPPPLEVVGNWLRRRRGETPRTVHHINKTHDMLPLGPVVKNTFLQEIPMPIAQGASQVVDTIYLWSPEAFSEAAPTTAPQDAVGV